MRHSTHRALGVFCTLILCSGLNGAYARQSAASKADDDQDVRTSLSTFTKAFEVVEKNYADRVEPDRVLFGPDNSNEGAIPGMLRTLDPHSNFFDPRAYALLREQQQGRYFGVGMKIQSVPGQQGKLQTMVVQPMPGSPAFRAGLRPGDILVNVDGKPTDGLNITQVATLLKGPRGTTVHVAVSREGANAPLEFTIQRDEISSSTVENAFLIRPNVAYVHISGFSETTADELSEALNELNARNLQGLVLDLRGNPGGLLQAAVDVADQFLQKNQLIVYQRGRESSETMSYVAQRGEAGNEYPIVVLINRMTASAAEIVTGALQDHDRALVMGEPSFGKGLVQTVYPLSENTGLALTTAHYFTPSGRLIQRNYSNISLYDYYYHFGNDPAPHTDIRLTDGGREVYGGGGITPDVVVNAPQLSSTEEYLERHTAFFNFAKHYLAVHTTIARNFVPDDQTLDEFKQFLNQQHLVVSPQDFEASHESISREIRLELVTMIYGSNEADHVAASLDPLVQTAASNLGRAKDLTAGARRYIAGKSSQHKNSPNSLSSSKDSFNRVVN
jgi:carboxyl-terminal processing protease